LIMLMMLMMMMLMVDVDKNIISMELNLLRYG